MTHENDSTGQKKQDAEGLLARSEPAVESNDSGPREELPAGMKRFELPQLTGTAAAIQAATLDVFHEVELDVRIDLGRAYMHLEDVLKLEQGEVVPLDKAVDEPVDILVGGRLIARGEIFVLDDNFCVRVSELVAGVAAV